MLPLFAPRVLSTMTGNPVSMSVFPLVPPELSYNSTCSRTHWVGLGSYSPSRGMTFVPSTVPRLTGTDLQHRPVLESSVPRAAGRDPERGRPHRALLSQCVSPRRHRR